MGPWDALVIIVAIIAFVILVYIVSKMDPLEPPKRTTPPPMMYWEKSNIKYPCPHVKFLGDTLVGFCTLDRNHEGEHNLSFSYLSGGDKHGKDLS